MAEEVVAEVALADAELEEAAEAEDEVAVEVAAEQQSDSD